MLKKIFWKSRASSLKGRYFSKMKEWKNTISFLIPNFLAFQFITNLLPFSIFFFFKENMLPFICFVPVLAKRYFSISHLKRSVQVRNVWGMLLGKSGKMAHKILVIIWLIISLWHHRISGLLTKARCFLSQRVSVCVWCVRVCARARSHTGCASTRVKLRAGFLSIFFLKPQLQITLAIWRPRKSKLFWTRNRISPEASGARRIGPGARVRRGA